MDVDHFGKVFDEQRFDELHFNQQQPFDVNMEMGKSCEDVEEIIISGQQGIGKEDFARPYVKEKKLWKVIRNATIRQKSA